LLLAYVPPKKKKEVGCFGSIGLYDPESDSDLYGQLGLYFPDVLDQQWTAIVHSTTHQTGAKWFIMFNMAIYCGCAHS
jgi:hypothetical protein